MRPKSIVTFERLVLLQILLGIVNSFLLSDRMNAMMGAQGARVTAGTVMTIQAISIALYLILLYFISRKGSPVAKWIYVVLAAIGLLTGLAGISQTFALGALSAVIALLQYAITIATIYLLFRPDAKAWFSDGRGEAEADSFR